MNIVNKGKPFTYRRLLLDSYIYNYLIGAYLSFLTVGKCLNFPLMLHIQTQSFCNGQCSICPYSIVSKNLNQGTMPWDLFLKIANESASEPLLSMAIFELHNEPLLDKRLFDCISYFKSMNPAKKCVLVTNGELLDKFSLTDLAYLYQLVISLNAHSRDMYMRINSGLDYDRVMSNISYLLSNELTRRKVILSFVATKENEHEVYEATQYWNRKGVETRVRGLVNRAGTLNNYKELRLKTGYWGDPFLKQLWSRLMALVRGIVGCHLPFCQMNILFNGDVILCCNDWDRATVVGNVRANSLREVWNSEKMNEIRQLILRKRYDQINSCKECSVIMRE